MAAATVLGVLSSSGAALATSQVRKLHELPPLAQPLFVTSAPGHVLVGYTTKKKLPDGALTAEDSMVISIDARGNVTPLFAQPQTASSADCLACFPWPVKMKSWTVFFLGVLDDDLPSINTPVYFATDGTPKGTSRFRKPTGENIFIGQPFGDSMLKYGRLYAKDGTETKLATLWDEEMACGDRLFGFDEKKQEPGDISTEHYLGYLLDSKGVSQGEIVPGKKVQSWECVDGELALSAFERFERNPNSGFWERIGETKHHVPATGGSQTIAKTFQAIADGHLIAMRGEGGRGGEVERIDGMNVTPLASWQAPDSAVFEVRPLLSVGKYLYFYVGIGVPINIQDPAWARPSGIWRTDGTATGTVPLATGTQAMQFGPKVSTWQVSLANGKFVALGRYADRATTASLPTYGEGILESDGTQAGTIVHRLPPAYDPQSLYAYVIATSPAADGTRVGFLRRQLSASGEDQFAYWQLEGEPAPPPGPQAGSGDPGNPQAGSGDPQAGSGDPQAGSNEPNDLDTKSNAGCACRAASGPTPSWGGSFGVAFAVVLAWRRRRGATRRNVVS